MRLAIILAAALSSLPALSAPRVAADIAPVHSLVAMVMDGVASPGLVIPAAASPHGHALRPSEAALLADADMVVMVGPDLDPGFAGRVERLAPGARHLVLTGVAGMTVLARSDHDTGPAHAGADDHAGHHHHGPIDPHIWLAPANARAAVAAIADALERMDPANAAAYRDNAARSAQMLATLETEIAAELAAVSGRPFLTAHDAIGYFADRFGLRHAGSVTPTDAQRAGAARIADLRARIEAGKIACLFAEPQQPERMLHALVDGTGARVARIDPLGAGLEAGPGLYPALLRGLAEAMSECLGRGPTN